jgi:hypothetical protein
MATDGTYPARNYNGRVPTSLDQPTIQSRHIKHRYLISPFDTITTRTLAVALTIVLDNYKWTPRTSLTFCFRLWHSVQDTTALLLF